MNTVRKNEVSMMTEIAGVRLPTDILPASKFEVLPSTEKERYIRQVLKAILDLNHNGVTAPQIHRAIGFSRPTVWRHLEQMTATHEAYKLDYGHTSVYYANGRMLRHLFKDDLKVNDRTYSFILVANNFGEFIYLQEKRLTRLGNVEVSGGLLIPVPAFEKFINALNHAHEEVEKHVQSNRS